MLDCYVNEIELVEKIAARLAKFRSLFELNTLLVGALINGINHLSFARSEIKSGRLEEFRSRLEEALSAIKLVLEGLYLSSSLAQHERVILALTEGNGTILIRQLEDLELRIRDDLESRVFCCIEQKKMGFFEKNVNGSWTVKKPNEVFDSCIADRFPSVVDDMNEAVECYIFELYPACVFHLMRIVEVCIPKLADIAGLNDAKPSWGSVLNKIDKIAFKTEFKDVPESIRPHLAFLRDISPNMHAIQNAWRNKVMHLDEKLFPITASFGEEIASEILSAVKSFMRKVSKEMPATGELS